MPQHVSPHAAINCGGVSEDLDIRLIRRPRQVDQPESADLNDVAADKLGPIHKISVDVDTEDAAGIVRGESAALATELHVPAADRDVVEKDVAVGMPPDPCYIPVEEEVASGIGAVLDHQKCLPSGKRLHNVCIGIRATFSRLAVSGDVVTPNLPNRDLFSAGFQTGPPSRIWSAHVQLFSSGSASAGDAAPLSGNRTTGADGDPSGRRSPRAVSSFPPAGKTVRLPRTSPRFKAPGRAVSVCLCRPGVKAGRVPVVGGAVRKDEGVVLTGNAAWPEARAVAPGDLVCGIPGVQEL